MSEAAILSGKVLKQTVPVVPLPFGPEAPTLRRLLLPQGELAQFHDGEEVIRYIAYIELRAGSVRGNHYHNVKEEWIYLIQGEVLLVVQDVQTKARESLQFGAGERVLIRPGVAHALQIVKSGQAIEFSKNPFDAGDIHRFPL